MLVSVRTVSAVTAVADSNAVQATLPKLRDASSVELSKLSKMSARYQSAAAVRMKVTKQLKLGLLGETRNSHGELTLSKGRMRMELEGAEHSLVIVDKKNLWAVTLPPAEFKEAAVQVIHGDLSAKSAERGNLLALLTNGGLLREFKVTGVDESLESLTFHLQPKASTGLVTRVQVRVARDVKKILGLQFWDNRENETRFEFDSIVFGKAPAPAYFEYAPPAGADVMKI